VKQLAAIALAACLLGGCSAYQRSAMDLASGDYARSVAGFEAIVAQSPGDAMAWRKLGYARYKAMLYRAATDAFKKALALVPDDPDATFYLGQSLILRGLRDQGLSVQAGYRHPDMFLMAQTISGEAARLIGTGLPSQILAAKMERARDVGFARQRIYQIGDHGFGAGSWGRLYLPIRNPAAGDDLI
jgi:tetratricopeptide (TPR) repeat protein